MSRRSKPGTPNAATEPPAAGEDITYCWRAQVVIGALLLVGLAAAGVQHAERLNSDGVAYLRLAEYWARGDWNLAVSGYWGPLLSWMMAALIRCEIPPMTAARLAMAASAFVFWIGSSRLLAATGVEPRTRVLGSCVFAAAALCWSVDQISPDLLLAGLICLALRTSVVLSLDRTLLLTQAPSSTRKDGEGAHGSVKELAPVHGPVSGRSSSRASQPINQQNRHPASAASGLIVGLWWALAYLAKAVALPVGVGTLLLGGALRWLGAGAARPVLLRHSAWSAGALLLLTLPWILVLSARYDRPTFSTSARVAHAVVGPEDKARSHPFGRTFHRPEAGRITTWEDPSRDPYAYWSPWESRAYFRHQLRLIVANLKTVVGLIGHVDALYFAALGAAVLLAGWRRGEAQSAGMLLGVGPPLMLLTGAYLPVYVKAVDERYLYALLPLGFACVASAQRAACRLGWLPQPLQPGGAIGLGVAGCSFLLAILPRLPAALTANADLASLLAADLANRLRAAEVSGPLAGSALIQGQRTGLFVAFHLRTPWFGDRPDAEPQAIAASGAHAYIAHRASATAAALRNDSRFQSLDRRLFTAEEEPTAYPLEVFVVDPAAGSAAIPSVDSSVSRPTP